MPTRLLPLSALALVAAAAGSSCTLPNGEPLYPGTEVQFYPTGVIFGFHAETPLNQTDVLHGRIAANVTDRDDHGDRDLEEGEGIGVGVGWRRFETVQRTGWLFGGRVDLWDLDIDWTDDPGLPSQAEGSTGVIVLQPAVEGGYAWRIGDGSWRLDLTASAGAEINLDEDGRGVGDGPIFLVGVTLVHDS